MFTHSNIEKIVLLIVVFKDIIHLLYRERKKEKEQNNFFLFFLRYCFNIRHSNNYLLKRETQVFVTKIKVCTGLFYEERNIYIFFFFYDSDN
jgi:hypothetical protein